MRYFLGVDVGGTKTHVLIADEVGQAVGFGEDGPGNWEDVGYEGLTRVLIDNTTMAMEMAQIQIEQIAGAGMGLAGYDWPSQRQAHLDAIRPLKLRCPLEIVNDATLGILAGSSEGWGISVVAGTGCNCRGWSKDHKHEGRVVGGDGDWSGEAAGGSDIIDRAMRAVTFEWTKRGPATKLSQAFLQRTGAKNLDDLIEGLYIGQYVFEPSDVLLVFQAANQGDQAALGVIRWAGDQLGQMACGVINQLDLQNETFEVVLIGSLYDGHPLIIESLRDTVLQTAPHAHLVRLTAPPVVGGVILAMQKAGLDACPIRKQLLSSTGELLKNNEENNDHVHLHPI